MNQLASPEKEQKMINYLDKGAELVADGKLEEAKQLYLEAIDVITDSAELYQKLGNSCLELKQWQDAVVYYQKALELNPNRYWNQCNLGKALTAINKFEEAATQYQKAISSKPKKPYAYNRLGEVLLELKQWEQGVLVLEKAIALKDSSKINQESISWKLLKLTSNSKFNLNESDIIALKNIQQKSILKNKHNLNYVVYNAEQRLNNQQELSKYQYKLVSLGNNCLPRTICTRWGLKLPKVMGELTHPFDLAIHPYETVCQLIQNDFEDYLNPSYLKLNDSGFVVHTKYKIKFPHEKSNCIQELIKTYEKRINNFYADICQNPIVFVIRLRQNVAVKKIVEIIKQKFGNTKYKLLSIDTTNTPISLNLKYNSLSSNINFIDTSFPYKDYVWYQPKHYATRLGLKFEKKIIERIKQIILDLF